MIYLAGHFLELASLAAIFMLLSISIARLLFKSLGVNVDDPPTLICSGLMPLLIGLFYAQETKFAVPLIWLWFAISVIAAIIALGSLIVYERGEILKSPIVQIVATPMLVGLIYTLLVGHGGPASLANNDTYNWYSVASTLIGKARYLNMSPLAVEAWPTFAHDAYGTNWMLALVGFFFQDPINSSTLFLVITSSLLALIFQWQLNTLFSLGRKTSFFVSIVPVVSVFYQYIAFNSFFAQLLGTIGGALLLSVAIRLRIDNRIPVLHSTGMLLLPVLWCLYVYQSGFLAFQFISAGYAFCLFVLSEPSKDGLKNFSARFLLPYSLALVVAAITNPGLALALVNRTLIVSDVVAGWPLPLLPAHLFAGIPWPDAAAWLYGGDGGGLFAYLGLVIGVFVFSRIHSKLRPNEKQHMIQALVIWYLILIGIYLYWFYSGRSPYQNWKFAAFFVFSSSAVPLGIFALIARKILSSWTKELHALPRYWTRLPVIIVGLALLLSILINIKATKSRLTKLGPAIEQLVQIRGQLAKDTKVNLLLGDYGHSMLPMLLLSPKASIYPFATTYIRPSLDGATGPHVINLMSVECGRLLQLFLGNKASASEVIRTKDYVAFPSTANLGFAYRFSADGGRCSPEGGISADFGFANPEAWGTWSDGSMSQLSVDIPLSLRGKKLEFIMHVQPYTYGQYKEQKMIMAINGKGHSTYRLSKPERLTFMLAPATTAIGKIKLSFEYPDAKKPAALDSSSTDQRILAVGYIALGINTAN